MKKLVSVISLLLMSVCLLTACSSKVYVPQKNIQLNYNNLSAGSASYWLENDRVFYLDSDGFESRYVMNTKKGQEILMEANDLSVDYIPMAYMQCYGNSFYYTVEQPDDDPMLCEIYQYDCTTKTETFLTAVEQFSNFYVTEDYIYIEKNQENFDGYRYVLDVYSLETGETMQAIPDMYACGIRNNRPTYLVTTDDGFDILEWNPQTQKSKTIGTLALPITQNITIYETVNFTSEYMILEGYYSPSDTIQIYIYNFKTKELKTVETQLSVYNLIAFENRAFLTLTDFDSTKTYLYSLELATGELNQLGRIHDDKSLFVTSDEEVYLCSDWEDSIVYYHIDGTKEDVLVAKP